MRLSRIGVIVLAVGVSAGFAGCSQQDPQSLIRDADTYRRSGEIKAAIIQYKNALKENPNSAEARFGLAQTFLDAGDGQSAEQEFRKARASGMRSAAVQFGLARALLLQNAADKALAELATLAAADPSETATGHALRGRAKALLGDVSGARTEYARALDASRQNAEALLGLAALELTQQNRLAEARAMVQSALAVAPERAEAWIVSGDISVAEGQIAQAALAYDTALKKDPKNVIATVKLVLVEINQNKLDSAQARLDDLKKSLPENGLLHYQDSLIAYRRGQFQRAAEASLRAMRIMPEHKASFLMNGLANFQLGSYQQAEQMLAHVLAEDPENLYARKIAVAALLRLKDRDRAQKVLARALQDAPQDSQVLVLASHVEMQFGRHKRAQEIMQSAIAKDPNNTKLQTELGLLQIAAGDPVGASQLLSQVIKADRGATAAAHALLAVQLQERKYDAALNTLARLETQQPRDPNIHTLRGTALVGKGQLAEARASFQRALELDANNVPALVQLSELDIKAGNIPAARKRFEDLLGRDRNNVPAHLALAQFEVGANNPQKAIDLLERARSIDTRSVGVRVRLAKLYLQMRQPLKAVSVATEASKLDQKNPEVLDLLGTAQLNAGNADNASLTFVTLLQSYPESPLAHYRIGMTRMAQGDVPAAVKAFRHAVELRPTFIDAQAGLTAAYLRAGQPAEAIKVARGVREQNPKSPVGYVLEADTLASAGRAAEAAESYRRALAIAPSAMIAGRLFKARWLAGDVAGAGTEMRAWLVAHPRDISNSMLFADLAAQKGLLDVAIEHYQAALKIQPNNIIALNNLALVYLRANNPNALGFAERAHRLAPGNPYVLDTYGWVLVQRKQFKQALESLEAAVKALPDSAPIRYHYGVALVQSGKRSEGRREIELALQKDANFDGAAQARDFLQTL